MMRKADYATHVNRITPSYRFAGLVMMTANMLRISYGRTPARALVSLRLMLHLSCGFACVIMLLTLCGVGEGSCMAEREDRKIAALRAERSLNPRPERVLDEAFSGSAFFDARDVVQVKYELVRRVQVEAWSVTRAVAAFGFSRPSYYAAAAALEEAGLPGLLAERPGPKRAHKLGEEVLAFVLEQLASGAAARPRELVALIESRYGVRVHPRSIERAVMRARAPKSGQR